MVALTKKRGPPAKEFFVFKKPMRAEGREENLLGVAFKDPREGTQSAYTPQGQPETQPTAEGQLLGSESVSTALSTAGARTLNSASRDGPVPPHLPTPSQDILGTRAESYRTPCPWPRFLFPNVYPNEATEAIGVEKLLRHSAGLETHATIIEAITSALKVNREDLDKTTIPVLRRWSMEDPEGTIKDLLQIPEYQRRIINLFEQQRQYPNEKKVLWVATNLIACGGLSVDQVQEQHRELTLEGSDPTDTINIKLGTSVYRIKQSTLKGKYKNDVILCMSYRKVRYERIVDNSPGIWQRLFGTNFLPYNDQALKITEGDVTHVFWVDEYEAPGQAAPFMSEKDIQKHEARREDVDGVFEEATFYESQGDDEFDKDGVFPPAFFGEDFDLD